MERVEREARSAEPPRYEDQLQKKNKNKKKIQNEDGDGDARDEIDADEMIAGMEEHCRKEAQKEAKVGFME